MLEQQIPEVHDGAACGLAASAHDERDERGDLLGGHDVAVDLGVAQLGDDVHADLVAGVVVQVGRGDAPRVDERPDVLLEVGAGDQAVVVGVAAAEPGHHGVVPPGELLAGVLGDAEDLGDDADRELVGEAAAEFDQGGAVGEFDALRIVGFPPLLDQIGRQLAQRRETFGEGGADEVASVDVAAAAVFDAAQLELRVAEDARRRTLGDRVEADLVEVGLGDVVVAGDVVAVVQVIVEDRVVVAEDPVVGVRVTAELAAVEDPRVDQRCAVGVVAHVDGLADRHVGERRAGAVGRVEVDDVGRERVGHRATPSAGRKPIFSSFSARRK